MICFLPSLSGMDAGGVQASVATVAEHIIYAGTTIGYEHVGIGSDFDGMLEGPSGLDTMSDYPRLIAELLAKSVSESDVQLVLGRSVLRVLGDVEQYAARRQRDRMETLCDVIGQVWTEAQRKMLADKGAERGRQDSIR
jgi:membrane dipeptidase